jgi:creatinine amidohydrolase
VLYLPVQGIGASSEHLAYPGTLTFSPETIMRAWIEIGDSVARTGCRKLIFANSHGGNSPFIDIVARELRLRHGMLAVNASWARFGSPEGLYSEAERKYGIHGGDRETSLMLAVRPEAVNRSAAKDFASAATRISRDFVHLSVTPPFGFGWLANDLNPDGAVGEADRATPAKGEASLAFAVNEFIRLLQDVAAFDLSQLSLGPMARHD